MIGNHHGLGLRIGPPGEKEITQGQDVKEVGNGAETGRKNSNSQKSSISSTREVKGQEVGEPFQGFLTKREKPDDLNSTGVCSIQV
jgi:hypothetical protein